MRVRASCMAPLVTSSNELIADVTSKRGPCAPFFYWRESASCLFARPTSVLYTAIEYLLRATLPRLKVPDGSAIAKALDYSLTRWTALTRYLDDGILPLDNNHLENQIRPIAVGRSNWLFAGSLRAGQRAAAVMSLIQSAKMNGHDPYAYLKDVFTRLPTQPASRIDELLPHRRRPSPTSP